MFVENAFLINQERILSSERIPDVWIFSQSIPVTSLVRSNDFFFTTDNRKRAALANTFLDIISFHKHQQRKVLNP